MFFRCLRARDSLTHVYHCTWLERTDCLIIAICMLSFVHCSWHQRFVGSSRRHSPISSRHWQLVQLYETAGWHCLTCSQHSRRVQFPSKMIFFGIGTAWPSSHCQIEMSERGGGKPTHRSCEKITDHCMKLYCIFFLNVGLWQIQEKISERHTHTVTHGWSQYPFRM